MKKLISFILLFPAVLFSQVQMFEKPLSPRIANYTIDCKLDIETKIITAKEVLLWKNTSGDYIDEMQFHLYLNAFKNRNSTFMKERGGLPKALRENESPLGWCEIRKIKLPDGTDLTENYEYIHPDDDNEDDRTVIALKLPYRLAPGKTIELQIDFETKIPYVYGRSGFKEDYFFVGQWFPKVGVYIDGKWNCHQYHRNSEFFADFGVYDVKITLPEKFTVGATGKLTDELNTENGLKQYRYYCEDVHDFAWTADTDYKVYKDRHKNIEITLLCQERNTGFADNYLTAVKNAIDYYGNYGKYPWPVVTIVDPEGQGTGGMEYPTLFTGIALNWLPESIMVVEMVTIHEFGHNYWQGMVASNEFEEAWLDEGINSYSTTKTMEYAYPGKFVIDAAGVKVSMREYERSAYLIDYSLGRILQDSWKYNIGGYSVCSYMKAELMLHTLEKYFGEELWIKVMRTYFERWKFKHPKTQDFLDVVHEVTGKDFTLFFDQYLNTNVHVDYKIHGISRRKGWRCSDPDMWFNRIKIRKDGQLIFPVEIEFIFADGSKTIREWDAKDAANGTEFIFKDSAKLTSVIIDPENKIEFEIYKTNNSWIEESNTAGPKKWAFKILFFIQNIFHLFGIFA